jgi:AcrR family transcriptional regulator
MGVKERKEREKARKINIIKEAARSLFFKKGFENCSMDEIAEKAEVSKGMIYSYFDSKDSLIFAVISGLFDFLQKELISDKFKNYDPMMKIKKLLLDYGKLIMKNRNIITALKFFEKCNFLNEFNDNNFNECKKIKVSIKQTIFSFINEAKKNKDISVNLSSEILLGIIENFLESATIMILKYHLRKDFEEKYKIVIEIFISGLKNYNSESQEFNYES